MCSDGVTAAGAVMSCIIRRKLHSRAENPGGFIREKPGFK